MKASSWIWQQPDWPQFRWQSSALEALLEQARASRQELLSRLETLEPPLEREAISALLGRASLGTAAIEGELLDPGQVRSSIARRWRAYWMCYWRPPAAWMRPSPRTG
jgi:Fic family protein